MAELLLERASALPVPAPVVVGAPSAPHASQTTTSASEQRSWLLAQLLRRLASMPIERLGDLLPALRILALILASAVVLRITAATLDAIDGLPLMGGLLELIGLVRALSFVSQHALRQQKRAELMVRIEQLRRDLLG